ncbi:hypothetical protein C4K15_5293 [Pseudomonas chlororaphis subsp. aurantiaca]|nr:hypothetical protein C4K15_5293 [Pseudomonas chlororaphis subsp. aurantiaca]
MVASRAMISCALASRSSIQPDGLAEEVAGIVSSPCVNKGALSFFDAD